MDVYFVRHGQTNSNLAKRHQHVDTQLNETGIRQIEMIAPKVAALRPTHIISSTQVRAVESAKIIIAECDDLIPLNYSFFEEYRRPDSLVGHRYTNIKTLFFIWTWFFCKEKKDNGESYQDFISRAKEARQHLESLPEDSRVVVVSHAIFINIFLQHLCSEKPMNLFQAAKCLFNIYTMKNAKIIRLSYSNLDQSCGWRVRS